MNQQITQAEFAGQQLPVYHHLGDAWMTGPDIGSALGCIDPAKSIRNIYGRHSDELAEYSCRLNLRRQGQTRSVRVFNEEGVMLLTFFSKQPKAKAFRRWAVGVLKAYRHGDLALQVEAPAETARLAAELDAVRAELAGIKNELTLKDELLTLYRERPAATPKPKKPAPEPLNDAERAEILRLIGQGLSNSAIAQRIGRSRSAVYMIRREVTGGAQ